MGTGVSTILRWLQEDEDLFESAARDFATTSTPSTDDFDDEELDIERKEKIRFSRQCPLNCLLHLWLRFWLRDYACRKRPSATKKRHSGSKAQFVGSEEKNVLRPSWSAQTQQALARGTLSP
mmetsp:Transcript_84807/g.235149  ORF Transcript_84807/g.235149 Transcript_84807/m.235149 type:complete len:122 (-) Transcript_84807:102-467(-)